jgi:hypothetical protein
MKSCYVPNPRNFSKRKWLIIWASWAIILNGLNIVFVSPSFPILGIFVVPSIVGLGSYFIIEYKLKRGESR